MAQAFQFCGQRIVFCSLPVVSMRDDLLGQSMLSSLLLISNSATAASFGSDKA